MYNNCKKEKNKPNCFNIFTGQIGPKGEKGPKGDADLITIRNTITAESYEEAKVIDDYKNNIHNLDFVIPKGKDGTGFNILGYYNTLDELLKEHNKGSIGDSYIIDKDLYIWDSNNNTWKNVGEIKGPKGDQGEPGPLKLKSSYLVLFNNGTQSDGIPVLPKGRLPLSRVEIDNAKIISFDKNNNTIKFNLPGHYKITFNVSAYPNVTQIDFDPSRDFVSIGFKETDTDNTYIGTSEWVFNGEPILLNGQGIISVPDTNKNYELCNLSKETIFLNSPDIRDISSSSYFINPLITIIIDYLGS